MATSNNVPGGQRIATDYNNVLNAFTVTAQSMTGYASLDRHVSALDQAHTAIETWQQSMLAVDSQDLVKHYDNPANVQNTIKVLSEIQQALLNAKTLSIDLDDPFASEDQIKTKLTDQLNVVKDSIVSLINLYPAAREKYLATARVKRHVEPKSNSVMNRMIKEVSKTAGLPEDVVGKGQNPTSDLMDGKVVESRAQGSSIKNAHFVKAKVMSGNWIADPYRAFANPELLEKLGTHSVEGVVVKESKLFVGNQIGGPSIWD